MPSIAMLITPERSHQMPAHAPMAKGCGQANTFRHHRRDIRTAPSRRTNQYGGDEKYPLKTPSSPAPAD